MKSKLLLIAIVSFLSTALLLIIYLNSAKENSDKIDIAMVEKEEVQEIQILDSSAVVVNVQEATATESREEPDSRTDISSNGTLADNTIETPDSKLWQSLEPGYQPEVFNKYQESSVERYYFKFARSTVSEAKAGDTISVFIPQANQSFYIAVDNIETYPNGDMTLHGWTFNDLGIRQPVTITQGMKGTFGNIATPEGSFTIEVVGDTGWIASTDDIRNQQSFFIPDYVIPEFDPETGKLITPP